MKKVSEMYCIYIYIIYILYYEVLTHDIPKLCSTIVIVCPHKYSNFKVSTEVKFKYIRSHVCDLN